MTNNELISICGEIYTSKNWNLQHTTVQLNNGLMYKVPVENKKDYESEIKTTF